MKVTTIEEAQDILSLKVDGLFGSLFTFEMSLERKPEKKNKGITLQSLAEQQIDASDKESEESLVESITLLSKQFNRVLKRFWKRSGSKPIGN